MQSKGVVILELKMFRFGTDPYDWIVAENVIQATNIYKDTFGEDIFYELIQWEGEKAIYEEPNDKLFSFYYDGVNKDEDTIENLIKKYCKKPDIFACSEF